MAEKISNKKTPSLETIVTHSGRKPEAHWGYVNTPVYRGSTIPELAGWYVFGDYCSGAITALQIEGREVARSLLLRYQPTGSALREGPDNELYALSLDGDVSMLVPA